MNLALQKWPLVVFCKKGILKNFANFTRKHLYWNLFLIKLQTCNFIKRRLQHRGGGGAFCEICDIFKNNYFEEYLQTTATGFSVWVLLKPLGWHFEDRSTIPLAIKTFFLGLLVQKPNSFADVCSLCLKTFEYTSRHIL